jgi:hypothetical protein
LVNTTRPENVDGQSVPVKSASIRVALSVADASERSAAPRGELNSPCVLTCVGGALLGESAVIPVVSIVSYGCVDRIVAVNDCMLVFGTASNVQVVSQEVGGGGFGEPGSTWMVKVPRHVRTRNAVGAGWSRGGRFPPARCKCAHRDERRGGYRESAHAVAPSWIATSGARVRRMNRS